MTGIPAGPAGPAEPAEPASRRRRPRRRRVVAVVVLLVLVPVLLAGGVALWAWWQLDPPGSPGRDVEIEIASGWGVDEIADELASRDVIGSSFVFRAYVRLTDAGPFQAGRYRLQRDLGVRAATDALEAGPYLEYQELSVPPGLWLTEIAERVGRLPGRDAQRFLRLATSGRIRSKYQPEGVATLEGLLAPDTYRFTEAEDEEAILRTMVRQFEKVADAAGLAARAPQGVSPYEVVTVASLVQQEAKLDEDRPLIASVVYNRLGDGTLLQIDATVLYAIGERKATNTETDRAVDSPYNTYRVTGLPPTPISGVTAASLRAALDPAATDFRYYVLADERGKHRFAVTYDEHLRNVAAAREAGLLG